MEAKNHTYMSAFSLLGLSDDPKLQPILFGLFLSIYLVTVLGNLLIILAISSDSHLHTPMYFFLSNLSFTDVCFISTTVSRMLVNIQKQNKDISYTECLTQVYFSNTFIGMETLLLTIMAYDRFVAICHPLNYMVIMNPLFCGLITLTSWMVMFFISFIHIALMKRLTFSIATEIPHFFCDLTPLLKITSSDALINNIFMYLMTALLGVFPAIGILLSYVQIASALMRMTSTVSRYKAFSTCGSHLSVVFLFYGSALGVYFSSATTNSPERSMIASVMYTVITPMVNPFIYSLRNKDVKKALGKFFGKVASCLLGMTDISIK